MGKMNNPPKTQKPPKTDYIPAFERACAAAQSDLSEFERAYANVFYSTYIGAGKNKHEARRLSLTEVYRHRILSGASEQSLNRARRWQQSLIATFPDAAEQDSQNWLECQRYASPAEFAEQLSDMPKTDMAEINRALDAIGLRCDGFVVDSALRVTPEIKAEQERYDAGFQKWLAYMKRNDKADQTKPPKHERKAKISGRQNSVEHKRKRNTKSRTQTQLFDLTERAGDLFD